MPPMAKVTINNSRNSTGQSGDKVQSDILKELKDMTFLLKKQVGVSSSGVLGGAKSLLGGAVSAEGGALATLLALVAAAGYDISGWSFGAGAEATAKDKSYASVNVGGEDQIAEIDNTTGKITDLLSIQEAKERGIVDETGKIYSNLQTNSTIWLESTKNLEAHKQYIILSNEKLSELITAEARAVEIQQAINEANNNKLKALIGKGITSDNITSDSVFYSQVQHAIAYQEATKPKEEYSYKQYIQPVSLSGWIKP